MANLLSVSSSRTPSRFRIPALHVLTITATTVAACSLAAPLPAVHAQTTSTTTREAPPNTDNCPQSYQPPQVDSSSESPKPGVPALAPLPTAETKAGGNRMSECGIIAASDFTLPTEVRASAWLVYDLDTGEVLTAKDPHGRYRPASIIKVLLAIVSIKELDLHKEVTISHESTEVEGSAAGIGDGGHYTVEQLLYGLLLSSGNDTAHALAQELGGDEATLDKINKLALSLGAQDTRPASYSGLDAPGMSTSAFDLGLIYRHAWSIPEFAKIVATPQYDFPGWGDNPGFQMWNDNQMLHEDPTSIGGKTGFTDAANHTYVSAVNRNGHRTAVILLDATTDAAPTWRQGQLLIDAALASHPSNLGVVQALPGAASASRSSDSHADSTETVTPPPVNSASESGGQDSDRVATWKILTPLIIVAGLLTAVLVWAMVQLRLHRRDD